MNTFPLAGYAAARGMKVWIVGPVSLYHQRAATLAVRGNSATIDADECLRWLNDKESGSVVYVSFGSIEHPEPKQAVELGLRLEASGHPFIWVVKSADCHDEAALTFLRGLEARPAHLGVGALGADPVILSHHAVGGFVTHCGWNSTLEAVAAGLPVVAWPHFTDRS